MLLLIAQYWWLMQEHIKKQILIRPDTHYRGYQQLGANVTRYEDGYQRDWHEAIDLYREQSPKVYLAKTIVHSTLTRIWDKHPRTCVQHSP